MSQHTPDDRARIEATVHGRVQGVNFRNFTAREARRLGVSGTVRNLPDGETVAVVAEGSRADLERSEERRVGEEWRYWRDWSSDVCSSDLPEMIVDEPAHARRPCAD